MNCLDFTENFDFAFYKAPTRHGVVRGKKLSPFSARNKFLSRKQISHQTRVKLDLDNEREIILFSLTNKTLKKVTLRFLNALESLAFKLSVTD